MWITIIRTVTQIIVLLVFADVIVGYFLSPYHKVRMFLDQIVQPFLQPIRNILPKQMMFDFSPIVLIILIQLVSSILARIV